MNISDQSHLYIGEVVRYFKEKSSFMIHEIDRDFIWHGNYYDRIIGNQYEYSRIQQCILDSLVKWELKMRK